MKNWRLPTLAEPIGLLPSARLCLTAEFGMGSGRTTALWPPRNGSQKPARQARISNPNSALIFRLNLKEQTGLNRDSLKTAHRITEQLLFVSFKSHSSSSKKKKKSDQAARPISTSRLNVLQRLHLWPIKRVVCPWSLGSLRPGKHYLGRSLALRCFQRLSLPHMATQRCP